MNNQPPVTLVVAMRNEEMTIRQCLESIAAQTYPPERLEVLVYDGMSTDQSVRVATEAAGGREGWAIRPNPARIQAAAWNAGIQSARGDVIGIVSGHVELAVDYVERAVAALDRTHAWMVGGPYRSVGIGLMGRVIAAATSSRFGIGNASHHYTEREREVDSVFMGVCRAATYRAYAFDESLVRDQDDELSYRMRKAGGRIICDPSIRSTYRNRTTLVGLWRQYFAYGFWKVQVLRRHPRQMRLRQFAPAAFVIALAAGLATSLTPIGGMLLLGIIGAYVASAGVAAVLAQGPIRPLERATIPVAFATMHLAYGIGFLTGLVRTSHPTQSRDRVEPQSGGSGEADARAGQRRL